MVKHISIRPNVYKFERKQQVRDKWMETDKWRTPTNPEGLRDCWVFGWKTPKNPEDLE